MNEDALKLGNQLCFRLAAVSRNMTRLYQPLLEKYKLTYPQYIILLVLFEHKFIDFKELSIIVDLKTGTLTPIIQKLEEMGYVNKNKNPKDGRKIIVSLTNTGEELKYDLIEVPHQLVKLLDLEVDNYYTLINQLDVLLDKIQIAQKRER
ncbi:MarR family transcriptional regulator [Mycoplasmatota bacterium WC44]